MSDKPESAWAKAVSNTASKFMDLIKILIICATILASLAAGVYCALAYQKSFAVQESRLAIQIKAVISSTSLNKDQKEQLIRLLITKYDPVTDSLNPVSNPNAKPIELKDILGKFKLNGEDYVPKEVEEPKETFDDKTNFE